jgi:hypothetical protein
VSDRDRTRTDRGELADDPSDEPLAVRSIELDTDDGETVVIAQQNQGGRRQAGGGECKATDHAPSVEEAASDQRRVDESTDEG